MASTQRCLAHLSRNVLNPSIRPTAGRAFAPALIPIQQVRTAIAGKGYKKKDDASSKKKKKPRKTFLTPDLKEAEQFALLDAIRYGPPSADIWRSSQHAPQKQSHQKQPGEPDILTLEFRAGTFALSKPA